MARKRQIDPGIWTSEQFMSLSMEARLLFIGLISNSDDEGRLKASAPYLKALLYPSDSLSLDRITAWLREVSANGLIVLYQVDDKEYAALPTWHKHQYVNRPQVSQIPPLEHGKITKDCASLTEPSRSTTAQVPHRSGTDHEPVSAIGIGIGIDSGIGIGIDNKGIHGTFSEWCMIIHGFKAFKLDEKWAQGIEADYQDIDLVAAAKHFVDYWGDQRKPLQNVKTAFRNNLTHYCRKYGRCLKETNGKTELPPYTGR